MNFIIPRDVSFIIKKLRSSGYEAYAVGGCVRDTLLSRTPNDWDITTSALPLQVKNLFKKTVDTGLKHGTVTVIMNGTGYEVTTYRIDGEYNDCRHPETVTFTSNLAEDLRRRDFTINAFVYNEEEGVIDLFNGLDDLREGIIRCVGDPIERFTEDALRILRAVRFAAQLSFRIDGLTAEAAQKLAPNLTKVSAERIHVELEKLLLSANPDYISKLRDLSLAAYVLPELEGCSVSAADILCTALKSSPASKYVRWAVLNYAVTSDAAEPAERVREIMKRLKSDNFTTEYITRFITLQSYDLSSPSEYELRRLLNLLDDKDYRLFLEFRKAICHFTVGPEMVSGELAHYDNISQQLSDIIARGDCTQVKQMNINGRILLANGFPQGKSLGFIIEALLDRVLENPSLNETGTLLSLAREIAQNNNLL